MSVWTGPIQLRHGTAIEWSNANPILLPGEKGIEVDTGMEKNGDGVTAWNSLPYASSGGDKTYNHNQNVSASTWVITHNLGKNPNVQVFDSAGTECFGDITYNTANQITITFSAAFTGVAYLN